MLNVWNVGAFIFAGILIVLGLICSVLVYRIDKGRDDNS